LVGGVFMAVIHQTPFTGAALGFDGNGCGPVIRHPPAGVFGSLPRQFYLAIFASRILSGKHRIVGVIGCAPTQDKWQNGDDKPYREEKSVEYHSGEHRLLIRKL
jgi:hypothetical protein